MNGHTSRSAHSNQAEDLRRAGPSTRHKKSYSTSQANLYTNHTSEATNFTSVKPMPKSPKESLREARSQPYPPRPHEEENHRTVPTTRSSSRQLNRETTKIHQKRTRSVVDDRTDDDNRQSHSSKPIKQRASSVRPDRPRQPTRESSIARELPRDEQVRNEEHTCFYRENLEAITSELRTVKEQFNLLYKELERTRSQLHEQQQLTTIANSDLHQTEIRLEQTTNLLNIRSAELTALQTFYPKEDSVSGTDLKGMVDSLNNEIMQTSAVIADSLQPPARRSGWAETKAALEALREQKIFGALLGSQLDQRHKLPDPTFPVQIAVQACLARISWLAISSLHTEGDDNTYSIMDGVRRSEKYPVFAKWRAITHAELRRRGANDRHVWLRHMVESACDALVVAGWPEALDQNYRKAWGLKNRFKRIVDMCMDLNQVIMQKVFSMRVELICPSYKAHFHGNEMEEELSGDSPSPEGRTILCTTGLGLACEEIKLDGPGQVAIALKAKVATPSMFKETREPTPPQRRSTSKRR